jgi:hypothetical protein
MKQIEKIVFSNAGEYLNTLIAVSRLCLFLHGSQNYFHSPFIVVGQENPWLNVSAT